VDGAAQLNTLSLVISVTALVVSSILTRRQAAYARSQLVMNFASFFTEARNIGFIDDVRYVCGELSSEFVQAVAVSSLPDEARKRVYRVVNYFDQLGLLVASGTLEANIVIGLLGNWLDQCWRALEPYVMLERRKRAEAMERGESISGGYLQFFADLVVRTRRTPPAEIQERMRLCKVDGP